MKPLMLVAVLGVWLGLGSQTASAGVGDWVKNSASYLFSPVNAVANLGVDVWQCTTTSLGRFVATVAGNVSRNPVTLAPIFTRH